MTDLPPPPPPPPGAAPAGAPGNAVGASLGRRFAARLLDTVLVLVVVSVAGAVLVWPSISELVAQSGDDPAAAQAAVEDAVAAGDFAAINIQVTILLVGISIGYYLLLEPLFGGSLGKKALGLEVRGEDGGRPSAPAAIIRNAWLLLWAVPIVSFWLVVLACGVIAITITTDDRDRGIHDRLARTTVVRR